MQLIFNVCVYWTKDFIIKGEPTNVPDEEIRKERDLLTLVSNVNMCKYAKLVFNDNDNPYNSAKLVFSDNDGNKRTQWFIGGWE